MSTAGMPTAARTSRPCAQVSMSRAVTNERGRMPEAPRHPGGRVETGQHLALARPRCPPPRQHLGPAPAAAGEHSVHREVLGRCEAVHRHVGSARGSPRHVSIASSSVSARCATVSRTSQPFDGVGRNQSSRSIVREHAPAGRAARPRGRRAARRARVHSDLRLSLRSCGPEDAPAPPTGARSAAAVACGALVEVRRRPGGRASSPSILRSSSAIDSVDRLARR